VHPTNQQGEGMSMGIWQSIVRAWRRFKAWLSPPEPQDFGVRLMVTPLDQNIDWFVWESEQIQRGGYAPWFDHQRYAGTRFAFPEPTPEQAARVIRTGVDLASAIYGSTFVLGVVREASNIAATGEHCDPQDPFGWAMKKTGRELH
jgi:hypothetical protein